MERPGHDIRTLLLGLALLASPAQASEAVDDSAVDRLEALLAASRTVQAQFHQTLRDAEGEIVQEADGELWVARPDRFRWDYQEPYDQLIVSDGVSVWIYDRELEQVTVRAIDEALANSPAALLAGTEDLRGAFEVLATENQGARTRVTLAPRSRDTDFNQVMVEFDERALRRLVLSDALDQTTIIELSDQERGMALDDALFRFEAPEGVDVLGEEGAPADGT